MGKDALEKLFNTLRCHEYKLYTQSYPIIPKNVSLRLRTIIILQKSYKMHTTIKNTNIFYGWARGSL